MSTPHAEAVVIGGGIAGLTAAWTLQQAGVRYTLLEKSDRWGGKVRTDRRSDYVIEHGPDGFITRKPWALELARDLGLEDRLIPVNDLPERIYVLTRRGLAPLPDGMYLLVPTRLMPFLRSPLFSWRGKLRMLREVNIPPKGDDADESLADFIRRRLGDEALDKLGEPLLAGVYNADPETQSILATFPNFRKLEADHGSLIRGMRQRKRPASAAPALMAFQSGMGELTEALVEQLDGDLRLNTAVQAITRTPGSYTLRLDDSTPLTTPHLIVATQADVAAHLLREVAPEASEHLAAFRYAGIGNMTLAYRRQDVAHPLDAYGIVIPGSAGRRIDGITFTSSKWSGRSADDTALLRVFFGGPQTRAMLDRDDDDLLAMVREELHDLLGVTGEPLYHQTTRWQAGYPQYDLGHRERVAALKAALPDDIQVVGNAYHGVGLPDTIRHARQIRTPHTEKKLT